MQHAWVKRRQAQAAVPPVTEKDTRRQLAWAAGSEFFSHRDPLYHITEDFRQTFDEIGRRHAAALAGESAGGFTRTEQAAQPPQWAEQQTGPVRDAQKPNPTNAKDLYQMRWSDNQDMVRRFSETAFQRGTLAGAVMAGTGKMMLVSCLKRTVGQSQPVREQQRRLFEGGSQQRVIPCLLYTSVDSAGLARQDIACLQAVRAAYPDCGLVLLAEDDRCLLYTSRCV